MGTRHWRQIAVDGLCSFDRMKDTCSSVTIGMPEPCRSKQLLGFLSARDVDDGERLGGVLADGELHCERLRFASSQELSESDEGVNRHQGSRKTQAQCHLSPRGG